MEASSTSSIRSGPRSGPGSSPDGDPADGVCPVTILLIEDNPGDVLLLREELRDVGALRGVNGAGFELECADRLATGLARLDAGGIDVILLDLSLPDATGLATLATVRQRAPEIPVLVLTGLDDNVMAAQAVREGAQDYLVKGNITGEVLERTIRYAIERGRHFAAERTAREALERANVELVRLAAEASSANRAKSAFLAMMSHELRTPLNAILGYAQLIEMELHGPVTDAQRDALRRISANQARLHALIAQILDHARLESGRMQLRMGTVTLGQLLRGVEDAVAPQVRAKALSLEWCCGDVEDEPVWADPERVQQILLNLIANAVKFTDEGGTIAVSCDATPDHVAIHVRDTGCGIPPDKLGSIFEPFVQLTEGVRLDATGVGLGLAISRDLARAMHGELTVQSQPGVGSTFTLTLPRQARAG